MADRGLLGTKVDVAVFADTGAEPAGVYEWFEFLKSKVSIPVVSASRGNIADDIRYRISGTGKRFASVPFFTKDKNGKKGMGRRQCTREYKIDVVKRAVREYLGYKKGQRMKHQVEMLIGISTDEPERMKPSRTPWIKHRWPLIEKRMDRQACIELVDKELGRKPPRSACWLCPFRSNEEWRVMKKEDPESWAKAVELDRDIRQIKGFRSEQFIHRERIPLEQVQLDNEDQGDLFGNECEGMCGV